MSPKKQLTFIGTAIIAMLLLVVGTVQATIFTVTNTSVYESWATPINGSLRKALADAAAAGAGSHSVVFDFIALGANPIFTFTGDEYKNNTSTFGLSGTNVTLDGLTGRPGGGSVTFTSAPYSGGIGAPGTAVFTVVGTNNTVKGITFTSTGVYTVGLKVSGTGHTIQQNNFINDTGIGLRLSGTTNTTVKNNLVENNGFGGILVDGACSGLVIGGCSAGDANTIIRNGNSANVAPGFQADDEGNGITLGGQFLACTSTAVNPIKIMGNYIGTTSAFNYQDGSSNFLGNSHHGISIWQSANVIVGGACPNYVSNNGFRREASGISLYGSTAITVDNNIIGTDGITGKKLGNRYDGITINASANNIISNNIIGNSINGIGIRNTIGAPGVQPVGNTISNNKIGVDNLGNFISTSTSGISIEGNATTTLIQSNTIKASGSTFNYGNGKTNPATSDGVGIYFQGTAGNTANSVFSNIIGRQTTDGAGANNIGNAILVKGSTNNLIGDVSKGNIIGSNGITSDIVVDGSAATGNKITYNQFVCNGLFATKGIELINTGNVDFGKTALVFVDMGSSGTITGGAPANSTVHVYSRAANCNQCLTATTGNYSRGNTLLGIVTASAAGVWSYTTSEVASNIVVTATDASNNTSEFSFCKTLTICPTVIAAGPDQELCSTTTATLAATTPDVGAGVWTTVSGPGVATNPTSINSGVTGLDVATPTVFRWTVSQVGCTPVSKSDDIKITVYASVTATAGSAFAVCNSTTANLAATVPSLGTGAWTTTAGTGIVTTAGSATSGVTGLTVGSTSTFLWTVTNGACSASNAVIVTSSAPVTANAGSAFAVCNATTANLAATVPSLGTGTWTKTAGTGAVTTPGSATSGVTGLTIGSSSTFEWTVTNGACTASNSVIVTSSAQPTADAGSDISLCNITTGSLAATAPALGSGTWTTVSGSGVASTPSSNTSNITGLTIGASTTFKWTVTNGACSANEDVIIAVTSPIVVVNATQAVCNSATATLSAIGTGTWAVTSGTGVVTTPSNPTSEVTGLTIGSSSTFEWTITSGGCTNVVQKVLTITVSNSATADAGSDIGLCNATVATLAATGTGVWTKVSGSGNITTPSSPTSEVTGLTIGETSEFKWSVENGACTANETIKIVSTTEPQMNAGYDFKTCLSTFALDAISPGGLYAGVWTGSPGIVFTPAENPKATISGLMNGINTIKWTVAGTGFCTGSYERVYNITYGISDLTVKLKAPDDTACVGMPKTLYAKAEGGSGEYKYVWYSNLNYKNPVIDASTVIVTTTVPTYDVVPNLERNLYWLVVYDTKNVGCATPFSADTIFTSLGQDLNVPNLITPNEDGKNDYWELKDKVTHQDILPGSKFDLYNRWGERVFTMDNYDNRFNAPHISDGVYYYFVKSGCGGNEYKGWLQILGNNNP